MCRSIVQRCPGESVQHVPFTEFLQIRDFFKNPTQRYCTKILYEIVCEDSRQRFCEETLYRGSFTRPCPPCMKTVLRVWVPLLGHLGRLSLFPSLLISMGCCTGLCLLCFFKCREAALGHASISLNFLKQVGPGWSPAL